MHRRTFGAGGVFLLLSAAARQAQAASDVVRIGWLRAPNDITTGKARGTIEAALAAKGAKVEWAGPFAAAAPALEALNAGAIDITGGSSTACVTALAAGVPMLIWVYQRMSAAAEGIVVKRGSPIRALADLKGRTVAVNHGGTGAYLLTRALARNGIDMAAVTCVYLSPGDSGAAFREARVDAWATWDPFLTIVVSAYDARILADGAAIGSENAVTLMTSRAFSESRHDLLDTLFRTALADNAWSLAHKREAGTIWCQAMGIPATLAADIGAHNAVPAAGVTDADITQLDDIADLYMTSKIIHTRPNIAAGVTRFARSGEP